MSNPAPEFQPSPAPERTVRDRIDANRAAVARAEDAHVQAAIAGQRWERRGLLGRLRRIPGLRGI